MDETSTLLTPKTGSWGHGCWARPDPGGHVKAQVASLLTRRKRGPFWSLHKGRPGTPDRMQGNMPARCILHFIPSDCDYTNLISKCSCYLRLMFWNMMRMYSLSPVLPERSWEQKLRHPSLSKSNNSLLKTCCRQNLQGFFLIVTWKNNEFLFYLKNCNQLHQLS